MASSRPKGLRLPSDIRHLILKYRSQGNSIYKICDALEKERNFKTRKETIWRFLKHFKTTGSVAPRPHGRLTKKIKPIHKVIVGRLMQEQPDTTSKKLKEKLKNELNLEVSDRTVRTLRKDLGWKTTKTRYCQLISVKNKKVARLVTGELEESEEQIQEGLSHCDSENDQIKALQAQLKFRKTVLCQKHSDKKIFNFLVKVDGGKYRKLKVSELKTNLKELVRSATEIETSEIRTSGLPLLGVKKVDHKFEDKVYRGDVISIVPGFNKWYNIKYEGDDAVYAYELLNDYKRGDLNIIL